MHLRTTIITTIITLTLNSVTLTTSHANWRTDIGWDVLQSYAGASLPTGSSLSLEMVEAYDASNRYMPSTGLSSFSGITFTNISNTNTGISSHATTVAGRYFGHTSSLLSGATTVGVRSASDFINNVLLVSGELTPGTADVTSHAYVGSPSKPEEIPDYVEIVTRFDYFSQESGGIHITPMNNDEGSAPPPVFGSVYNSISVGVSDGTHSYGDTQSDFPGPGRSKPDIVVPDTATSWATGDLASAAALLRAKGIASGNADSTLPDTIKACLLAGATKAEFPGWSQSTSQPLDTIFGVGELNIFHSYRILEQAESAPGNTTPRGWGRNNVRTNRSRTYTFTTPNYGSSFKLSAALIWQRGVSYSFISGYSYQALENLKLELLNDGGSVIQSSDSSDDNVEHIWNTQLSPNTTYSLKVSSSSGTADFSLAWRVQGDPGSSVTISSAGAEIGMNFDQLILSNNYTVQRSTDLNDWQNVHSFTSTSTTDSWTDTSPPTADKIFYRLHFFEP